jgi:hypothetical protein
MSSAQNIARKALADFFAAVELQRAHWYLIKVAMEGEAYCHDLNLLFPSLSSLLSVRGDLLTAVGEIAGVVYQRRNISSPLLHAWENFIAEYKLRNELTTFSVAGKKRILIRVGSRSQRQPAVTPKVIWSTRASYEKPRLRISTLSMSFAAAVGNLDIGTTFPSDENDGSKSDASFSSSGNESDSSGTSIKRDTSKDICLLSPSIHLPKNEFPLT